MGSGGGEPAAAPKASWVLMPSIEVAGAFCAEPLNTGCEEPDWAEALGVESTNSCHRRPLTGSDSSCAEETVVVSAVAAGSAVSMAGAGENALGAC